LVGRGLVKPIGREQHGTEYTTMPWENGGIRNWEPGDDVRILRVVNGAITYKDLDAAGISEADFRGGKKGRRTDHPWPIAERHRDALRDKLEPQGFNVGEEVEAQEPVDGDHIRLRQEYPRA